MSEYGKVREYTEQQIFYVRPRLTCEAILAAERKKVFAAGRNIFVEGVDADVKISNNFGLKSGDS